VVATRSEHKLRELRELIGHDVAELISLDDAGVPRDVDPIEDGDTFVANARIKARAYARASGLPTLADDSGIEVQALGGGPGVFTRRYAGPDATDADNNAKLLAALDGLPPDRRGARYVCVLVLADGRPDAAGPRGAIRIVAQTQGTCRGRIATAPRGHGGFGYDPIFEPASEPPGGRTLGLWSVAEKHRISHRARAARRMARRVPCVFTLPETDAPAGVASKAGVAFNAAVGSPRPLAVPDASRGAPVRRHAAPSR
jgi:XTP/dITP diphosphohydrolase